MVGIQGRRRSGGQPGAHGTREHAQRADKRWKPTRRLSCWGGRGQSQGELSGIGRWVFKGTLYFVSPRFLTKYATVLHLQHQKIGLKKVWAGDCIQDMLGLGKLGILSNCHHIYRGHFGTWQLTLGIFWWYFSNR